MNSSLRRRIALAASMLATGLVLTGCAGATTGAKVHQVGSQQKATLHAKGSCDNRCIAFFRITKDGKKFKYTQEFTVGRIGTTPFNVTVNVASSTSYAYQVCGAELPKSGPKPKAVCVGRDGKSGSYDKFRTGQVSAIRSTSVELDGLSDTPPLQIAE